MKHKIKHKATVLLGSNPVLSYDSTRSKIDLLCDNFIDDAIEEVLLSVHWTFALKKVELARSTAFESSNINDCLKVALMMPSKAEWYIESGVLLTKSDGNITCFYYPASPDKNSHTIEEYR